MNAKLLTAVSRPLRLEAALKEIVELTKHYDRDTVAPAEGLLYELRTIAKEALK